MTLKEKFESPMMRSFLVRDEIEEIKEQCAKIADEHAEKFGEWFRDYQWNGFNYSVKEILEVYKKEKGL